MDNPAMIRGSPCSISLGPF